MASATRLIELKYGTSGRFRLEIEPERVIANIPGPPRLFDLREQVRLALTAPLDFPPLSHSVIPDDRVAIALDYGTPQAEILIESVWEVLSNRGIHPDNVSIVQAVADERRSMADPRRNLPEAARDHIQWVRHRPGPAEECAYLASSTGGERVYLAREIVDADFTFSIGALSYDPLIGYRGTNSVFYPGLSTEQAVNRSRGQGHSELTPEQSRPLRQLMDEIGWLLGTQFTLQVIPSVGDGITHVLAGGVEGVYREGCRLLTEEWFVELSERPDVVVAAVDADAESHGWKQVGSALAVARNLVQSGGKIVLLTELDEPPGEGMEIVKDCDEPRDAIRPLRQQLPADLIEATQLADAVDWASVYFLSRLDSTIVEDLFMIPVDAPEEICRLLTGRMSCVFLASAQKVFGRIEAD